MMSLHQIRYVSHFDELGVDRAVRIAMRHPPDAWAGRLVQAGFALGIQGDGDFTPAQLLAQPFQVRRR